MPDLPCGQSQLTITDLLADETPNMDLAGQCLPSLKLLLDQTLGAQVPAINATSEKVIHGLLGACLSNIDDMRYVSGVRCPRISIRNSGGRDPCPIQLVSQGAGRRVCRQLSM